MIRRNNVEPWKREAANWSRCMVTCTFFAHRPRRRRCSSRECCKPVGCNPGRRSRAHTGSREHRCGLQQQVRARPQSATPQLGRGLHVGTGMLRRCSSYPQKPPQVNASLRGAPLYLNDIEGHFFYKISVCRIAINPRYILRY